MVRPYFRVSLVCFYISASKKNELHGLGEVLTHCWDMICTFFKHTLQGIISHIPPMGSWKFIFPTAFGVPGGGYIFIYYTYIYIQYIYIPYMFVCHVHDFCMLPVKFGRPKTIGSRKPRYPVPLPDLKVTAYLEILFPKSVIQNPPYQRYIQYNLGGGFKYFLCSSLFGEMIQFD